MEQTVGQVARAAGISVRTLHHWEQVGLVRPSGRTANGYRAYGAQDVERVRKVLAWRELGLPLADIRALLEGGATTAQLHGHLGALRAEGARIAAMTATVERALEARRMGIELDPAEIREVFGEEGRLDPDQDPTRHAAEAQERWGSTDAYQQSQRRTSSYGKQDWLRMRAEQGDLESRMAAAMLAGEAGEQLAEEHRLLVDRWFYDCPPEMHVQLGEMYVADERFTAHYDRRAPGLARWLRNAIVAAHGAH
jgi:DNA-binding transcriptional MerR regulator